MMLLHAKNPPMALENDLTPFVDLAVVTISS